MVKLFQDHMQRIISIDSIGNRERGKNPLNQQYSKFVVHNVSLISVHLCVRPCSFIQDSFPLWPPMPQLQLLQGTHTAILSQNVHVFLYDSFRVIHSVGFRNLWQTVVVSLPWNSTMFSLLMFCSNQLPNAIFLSPKFGVFCFFFYVVGCLFKLTCSKIGFYYLVLIIV